MAANSNSITLPPADVIGSTALTLIGETTSLARQHAINKACLYLLRGVTPVPTIGGFLVESATRGGTIHRVSNINGCSCEAGSKGRDCWHTAMISILELVGQHYTMPSLATPDPWEQARARVEIEELFA